MPGRPAGENSGIVDKNIHPAVPRTDCPDCFLDLVFFRDVTYFAVGAAAGGPDLPAGFRSVPDIENLNLRALGSQALRYGHTQPHGRTRYDGYTILQSGHCRSLLVVMLMGDNSPRSFFISP